MEAQPAEELAPVDLVGGRMTSAQSPAKVMREILSRDWYLAGPAACQLGRDTPDTNCHLKRRQTRRHELRTRA